MPDSAMPSQFGRNSLSIIEDATTSARQNTRTNRNESITMSTPVVVLIQTCYEQWGRWHNYHLFRLFAMYKGEHRVRFSVDMILPKMALEIRIDGNVVYSRLMRSGFHNFSNLTEFVSNQINCALNGSPLHSISPDEYAKFMENFRLRDSDCVDQTDMRPNDDALMSTGGNSVLDRTNTSFQQKGRRNYTTTISTTVSH